MTYKFYNGPTKQDDIYAKKSVDADGDTYIDFEENYIGIVVGGTTLLAVSGSVVSSSTSISASTFHGDGSNLTGIAGGAGSGAPTDAQYITLATDGDLSGYRILTAGSGITLTDAGATGNITVAATAAPIHAPWVSGSTDTYSSMISTTTDITVLGANLTSTSVVSFDSQFATDGHSIGSMTFISPTEIVVPITTGTTGSQYTMTITNADGLTGTLTNAYKVSTHQLYALDSLSKFTSIDDMAYGADSYGGNTWTGIHKTTTAGWNAGCRSIAQINNSDTAYVQWKMDTSNPGNGSWRLLVGLGYVNNDNVSPGPAYDWSPWQWYLEAGQFHAYNGPLGAVEYTNNSIEWLAGRTMRIEINNGTVSYKYSDDDGSTWTTEYTSTTTVDIASNSNLVVSLSVYSAHGYAATPENLEIYGSLTNT